jgi:Fe-Mn family superoxide dismutase
MFRLERYVTNLNAATEKLAAAQAANDVSAIIALQGAIKFNGGGHLNHSIFWYEQTHLSTLTVTPP